MKIRLNPIVKKDLQVTARSMRLSWGLFAYEAILTLAFLLALTVIQSENTYYYGGNIYADLVYLFPVVAVVQVCIVVLIVPIITASSISGERERQTLDIMLTTCMSPFSIVFGKVLSAVLRILFFVVASTPIMALSFVVGGTRWSSLFWYLLTIILLSVFSGSIGILCSAFCRKSITAVIMSYALYFVFFGLTFVPIVFQLIFGTSYAGESLLFWLVNPIMFYMEFFVLIMTGDSVMGELGFDRADVGVITYLIARENVWIWVSALCILLAAVGMMILAAWKVNPMHSASGKRKSEKG